MEQTKKASPHSVGSEKKNPAKKQTVTITDDLKVIITANNGLIDAEGNSSVYINGEFSIDADSVRRLSATLQGKNIYVLYPYFNGPTQAKIITSDKTIAATIENLKKEIEAQITENRALNDNLKKAELKNTKLLNEVRYYNSNRRPWERKINIEE
jgi:hypothetical protein